MASSGVHAAPADSAGFVAASFGVNGDDEPNYAEHSGQAGDFSVFQAMAEGAGFQELSGGGGAAVSVVPESEGGGECVPQSTHGGGSYVSDTVDGNFSRIDGGAKREELPDDAFTSPVALSDEQREVAEVRRHTLSPACVLYAFCALSVREFCLPTSSPVQLVTAGKNVFFTGSAGVGKSFMLNHIKDILRRKYRQVHPAPASHRVSPVANLRLVPAPSKCAGAHRVPQRWAVSACGSPSLPRITFQNFEQSVAVCAPTGIAATHIHGTTLHSVVRRPIRPPLASRPLPSRLSSPCPFHHLSFFPSHAQAGCGVPSTMQDFAKMRGALATKRWMELEVLIIDEISMVRGKP